MEDHDSAFHLIVNDGLRCRLLRYELKWNESEPYMKSGFALFPTVEFNESSDHVFCIDARLNASLGGLATLDSNRLYFLRYCGAQYFVQIFFLDVFKCVHVVK